MDVEPGWDEEDEEEAEEGDEFKTKEKSQKSKGSRVSRQSKAKSKMSKQSKAKTAARKSTATGRSKASRRMSQASRGTSKSKKTKTSLSRREEEDPAPAFLTVSHYDRLFRIHSMLSMIAPDAQKEKEFALDAHYFVMKMWEQSFQTSNALIFLATHKEEIEKLGYSDTDPEARALFYNEVFANAEIEIPAVNVAPESND